MSGGRSSRTVGTFCAGGVFGASVMARLAGALLLALLVAPSSQAFEAFDGRVQMHGYYESTMRALNSNYSEDWDVAQWYQIFNLEIELDLIQDTVGPIDLLSAFIRAEVRYDCVLSRGCGMFRSMNAYGDRSKSLPRRLMNANRIRQAGRNRIPNDPTVPDRFSGTDTDPLTNFESPVLGLLANSPGGDGVAPNPAAGEDCADINGAMCPYLAGADGTQPNGSPIKQLWLNKDDPFTDMAAVGGFADFRWVAPGNHIGDALAAGPWLPKNFFKSVATLSSYANPFDERVGSYSLQASVYNSTLLDAADNYAGPFPGLQDDPVQLQIAIDNATAAGLSAVGGGALPYRSAPTFREDGAIGVAPGLVATRPGDARGLFIPTAPVADLLNKNALRPLERDYNLSESRRAWNRGASQRDEKELKEAYLDIETLDNQLWLRVGKQQVVWGKTELFRTTDQFNPQDIGLASLPSLEESRIALWSVRGVYSFYEVGPVEDVRLELAFNFDDYQQTDLGACGEAYAPILVCGLTFAGFAHGALGLGLAGVDQPDDPWQSLEGWEVGGRLEWRWDRFSFALVDFYGYADLPTIRQISTFTRNVDPRTGRPRELVAGSLRVDTDLTADPYSGAVATAGGQSAIEQIGTQGACVTGAESACLTALEPTEDVNRNGVLDPGEDVNNNGILDQDDLNQNGLIDNEGLTNGTTAQQLFAFTCASSIGFSDLDRRACALNVFGSAATVADDPIPVSLAQALGSLLTGSPAVSQTFSYLQVPVDPNDPNSPDMLVPNPIIDPDPDVTAVGLGGFVLPFVQLSEDPGDADDILAPDGVTVAYTFNPNSNGETTECLDERSGNLKCGGPGGLLAVSTAADPDGEGEGIGNTLNPEQEALLGCGPFWGTNCDNNGVDLLNAEGSALFAAWVGVEGTTIDNDPNIIWNTDEKNEAGTRYLNQPGTREWYFDASNFDAATAADAPGLFDSDGDGTLDTILPDASPVSNLHSIGPVCTTSNFGGALYSSGDDAANGNQDVLPGCRRKWKDAPTTDFRVSTIMGAPSTASPWELFTGAEPFADPGNPTAINPDWLDTTDPNSGDPVPGNLTSLNFYGQDETCAADIAANGSASSSGCQYLEDYLLGDATQTLKDPRSWDYIRDSDPDGLGQGVFAALWAPNDGSNDALGAVGPVDGTPDFFYTPSTFNPYPTFDDCNPSLYGQAAIDAAGGVQFVPCGKGGHPITGQPFASEIAALSWNFMTELVWIDVTAVDGPLQQLRLTTPECGAPGADPNFCTDYDLAKFAFTNPNDCSLITPQLCDTYRTLMGTMGIQRNVRRAGGNGVHGRRTFLWQSGGVGILEYEKRNVLGFSTDFAEDFTKSNVSMEFTWIEGVPVTSQNQYNGLERVDQFNLTVSIDRPTFINFLNSNRTFFFNGQFFMGYTAGWEKGMTAEGPWSFLGTLAVGTGYFQDRLTPSLVSVYDFKTQSGALLTGIGYRFTQNFSASVGMAFFYGKPDFTDEPTAGLGPAGNRSRLPPDDLYKQTRDGGLAVVRERDEFWARIRYTF